MARPLNTVLLSITLLALISSAANATVWTITGGSLQTCLQYLRKRFRHECSVSGPSGIRI